MLRETQKLRNAFIPSGMANVIGYVFKNYRKKSYIKLANTREKVLRCAEAIINLTDIVDNNKFAISVKNREVSEIIKKAEQSLEELHQKCQSNIEHLNGVFAGVTRKLFDEGFFGIRDIYIGQLNISENNSDIISLLPGELINDISENGISIPIYASNIDDNFLFICNVNNNLTNYFSSIALDVIKKEPNASIFFVDLVGIGSNYMSLLKLSEKGQVDIWHNGTELLQGLEKLFNMISETYSSVLGETYGSLDEYNEANQACIKPYTYCLLITSTKI